jgi:hypothetical protein
MAGFLTTPQAQFNQKKDQNLKRFLRKISNKLSCDCKLHFKALLYLFAKEKKTHFWHSFYVCLFQLPQLFGYVLPFISKSKYFVLKIFHLNTKIQNKKITNKQIIII